MKLNFLFKLSYLNSNFELTLGYLNPALNNSAQLNMETPLIRTLSMTPSYSPYYY